MLHCLSCSCHLPLVHHHIYTINNYLIGTTHKTGIHISRNFRRLLNTHFQYAQKPHMHINFTCHFFKIDFMSILNLILTSSRINIALLHDKIFVKCHNIASIGILTCFIDTFCPLKSICVY